MSVDEQSPPVNRQYRQTRRAQQAAATRRAIREAATALFLEHGYGATTMRQVARTADVGERTLYDAVGSKEDLFQHVADVAIGGDEQPLGVRQRPEFQQVLAHDDPAQVIARFADHSAALLERAAPIIMVAVESAGAEPAMRAFADRGAEATREVAVDLVDHLGAVHPMPDPQTAVATVLAVCSPHVHQILRTYGGFTPGAYRDWLEATLVASLLVP